MSKSIDNKVVSMEFDNSKFEKPAQESISTLDKLKESLKFKGVEKGFNAIGKAVKMITFNPLEKGIDTVLVKFTAFERFTIQLYDRLANKIIDTGKTIASQTFTVPVKSGLSEYEEKMGAVQTIMAGSKASLKEVNNILEELNAYADQTIYSFSDMTNNIGKFTNAGVELRDAVDAIKGVSNAAALAGATSAQASQAMYNFAQALSVGSVQLIDWKSIVNANMATVEFKQQLIDMAVEMKTLTNQNGKFVTSQGKSVEAMGNFNDTLQDDWLTSEVLIATLKKYGDALDEDVGRRATAAATEVKTFSMMLDTLKESLQSGWAQSWEYIFGDFEKAKELWTSLSNAIGGFLDRMSGARNIMLKYWSEEGGRTALREGLINAWKALTSILGAVRDGFRTVFPPMTGEKLVQLTRRFEKFTKSLKPSIGTVDRLRKFFTGLFDTVGIGLDIFKALKNAMMPLIKDVFQFFGDELTKDMKTYGSLMSTIRKTISESKIFEKAFKSMVSVLTGLWTILKKAHTVFFEILGSFIDGGWSAGFEAIKKGFKELVETIWDTIKKLSPVQKVKELGIKIADKISEWPVGKAIVDFIKKIKDVIASSPVWNFCVKVVNDFVDMIQGAINRFRGVDTKPVSEFSGNVEEGFKPLEALTKFFKAVWNGVLKIWEVIGPTIKAIGKAIGTAFKNLYDGIKAVVNRSDMGDVGVFNAGTGLGLMMTSIAKFMLDLTSTVKNAGATIKGLKTIVDGLQDLFKAFKVAAYAKAMKECAMSIALLAGSLFVLSAIPSAAVFKATAALETLFVTLAKMLKELASMHVVGGKGKTGIMVTFGAQIAMVAGAIAVLVISMMALAILPYESIIRGTAVVILLMRALTKEVGTLSKVQGTSKVAGLILGFAIFFQMLLIPLAVLSTIAYFNEDGIWRAVGVIMAIMGGIMIVSTVMAVVNAALGGDSKSIKIGGLMTSLIMGIVTIILAIAFLVGIIALASLAGAEEVIADAMLIVKDILDTLFKVLAVFALVPGLLSKYQTVSTVTGTNSKGQFITKTSVYNGQQGAKGGWAPVIAAFLGLAAALMAVAATVAVFGVVRKTMSQSEWEDAYQAVFLSVTILGTFLVLFQVVKSVLTKANSSGLSIGKGKLKFANISLFPPIVSFVTAAAVAVIAIAGAAKMMSSVKVGYIVGATAITMAIVALLVVLAKMGEKSKKFRKSLKSTGEAFQIFAKGALYLAAGVAVVIAAIGLLAGMTGDEIDKVNANITKLAEGIRRNQQDIVDAVSGIAVIFVGALLSGFVGAWTEASNQIFDAIVDTLATLAVRAPEIVKNLFILLENVLDGIIEKAPEVTDKLVLAVAEVIDGLATAIEKYHIKIIEAVNKLIEAVLKLFAGIWARLWGVTKEGIDDFYEETKGYVKVIASTIMGLFIYKKVKTAKDSVFSLFETLKKKLKEVYDSVKQSRSTVVELHDEYGNLIGEAVEYTGTLKTYFENGAQKIKDFFKNFKEGITKAFSTVKGWITKHPLLTLLIAIGLAAKAILTYANATIKVVSDLDEDASKFYDNISKREKEYQEFLKKREDAYTTIKADYEVGTMYLSQIRDCVDAQGNLVKGKEEEFLVLQKNIEPYLKVCLDETTKRVTAEDEYGRSLDVTSRKLDKIYKKQMLQKKLDAAMESSKEAYEMVYSGKLEDDITKASKELTEVKNRLVHAFTDDEYSPDIKIGELASMWGKNDEELFDEFKRIFGYSPVGNDLERFKASALEAVRLLGDAQNNYNDALLNRKRYRTAAQQFKNLSKAAAEGSEEAMQKALDVFNKVQVTKEAGATLEEVEAQVLNIIKSVEDAAANGVASEELKRSSAVALEELLNMAESYGTEASKRFLDSIDYDGSAEKIINNIVNSPMSKAMKRIVDTAEKFGINQIHGLIEGLKEAKGDLFKEWDDLTEKVIIDYAKANGIESPSKVFRQFGIYEVMGLIQGVTSKEDALNKTYDAMAAGSIAAYTAAMTKQQASLAFTPMINSSGIQNGTAAIQSQLNGLSTSPIGATLTSRLAASVDTSQIDSDNSKILQALSDLLGGVDILGTRMENMQIVMDTGATVGALAPGMDLELGRRAVRKTRGV